MNERNHSICHWENFHNSITDSVVRLKNYLLFHSNSSAFIIRMSPFYWEEESGCKHFFILLNLLISTTMSRWNIYCKHTHWHLALRMDRIKNQNVFSISRMSPVRFSFVSFYSDKNLCVSELLVSRDSNECWTFFMSHKHTNTHETVLYRNRIKFKICHHDHLHVISFFFF